MSRFLVIDSDGPRVEDNGVVWWMDEGAQRHNLRLYLDGWRNITVERLRYLDPESK